MDLLNTLKSALSIRLERLGINREKALLLTLLVLSFIMFFYKLGAPSLFETDEVIYSQIAREIVRTGDWVTLHIFSKNYFIHPPFYMWLTAASSFVFGDNEFNTRLWNALFAVGLVYVTFLLGKKMFRDGVGLLAGFILATGVQYVMQARIAVFDIPLVFFEMLSLLFFFYWLEDKLPRYYYLFFLSMGLAVLMKGPVGILLPLLVIIPYLVFTGNLRALFNLRIFLGLFIAYLAGGTWYTMETVIHGRNFVDSVFGFYIIGRYLTAIEQHYGPWYFYLPVIIIGFMPWVSFLPYSIAYQWQKRGDSDNLFALLWMGIVFVFFSIAGTKLPGYIMSFYPLAAISISKMVQDHLSGEESGLRLYVSRAYKTLAVFSVILLVIGALLRVFEFPDIYDKILVDVNFMLLIVGIGGLISSVWFFRKRDSAAPIGVLIITMLIFSMYTASYTMIDLDYFKPMKAISLRINSQYMGDEVIIGYKVLNKGSFMHYLDKPVIWISSVLDLREQLKSPQKILLITNEKDFLSLGQDHRKAFYLLYKAGDMVLLSNEK
jgi:4-amino-4-deoxy-L-arabinose transferase-like glycosyltransferase